MLWKARYEPFTVATPYRPLVNQNIAESVLPVDSYLFKNVLQIIKKFFK